MKPIKEILLMKYLNPVTEEFEGVDIIAFVGDSSHHIASLRNYNDAYDWAKDRNVPIRIDYDYVSMHGDTPVFNLFESVLYTDYAIA